jgi:ABC-type nitrate/sulfonate/bicarbonate transport system substrate-binding protein
VTSLFRICCIRWLRTACVAICLTFSSGEALILCAHAAEIEMIRTAVPTVAMNFMHAALARRLGIDRQEGIALEIILMRVSVAMAALIAGNIDYNFAFESTVNAALQGAPVIGIDVLQDKPPYMVVARPEIRNFADLRGKVVAQNDIFSVAAYVFRQILRANGLKDKDYSMIGAGNDRQRLAALTTGRVQATTFSPPTHLMALKAGMKSLGLAKDYTRAANGVGTSISKIKDKRDQVKRFLRVLLKTDRWMKAHPRETIDFIMSEYKLDRETAASSYEMLMPTLSDNGEIGDDYIQEIIERWGQQSGAPPGVPLDRVRDFSIVREAARELGIR